MSGLRHGRWSCSAGPRPLGKVAGMAFTWVLHDGSGNDLRTSGEFDTKDSAEAWMGSEWSALLEEGAETVSLMEGDERLYKMGLREA